MQNRSLAALLVGLAAVFLLLGVLYAAGVVGFLSSSGSGHHHYKHAVVLVALAGACLVGANFARNRQAA